MYVCFCVCVCVYVCVCLHVSGYVYLCLCVSACEWEFTQVRLVDLLDEAKARCKAELVERKADLVRAHSFFCMSVSLYVFVLYMFVCMCDGADVFFIDLQHV